MNIVFVCTGNICRSPMAMALCRAQAQAASKNIAADSAGIYAEVGRAATRHAQDAAAALGGDLHRHVAKPLSPALVKWADLILCMTQQHVDEGKRRFPNKQHCFFRLHDYATGRAGEVADPYGGNYDTYWRCAKEIEALIERVIEKAE